MGDVLSWLLAGDPAVVWQAQRDLLGLPVGAWSRTRRRVTREGWGAELLSHRSKDGTWGGGWYSPKWTSTFYSLQLLTILGAGDHPAAVASGRLLLDRGVGDDGAVRLWVTQHPDTCVTGMLLQIACAVGLGADPTCEAMAGSLLREQMDDGGWNCERWRGATHSSFDTTISVLEGLAAWDAPAELAARVRAAGDGGREFLLAHRLYRSHHTGEVVHPALTRLSFPYWWHYDVLRALEHFRVAEAGWDERLGDPLALVEAKRGRDGNWRRQNRHPGRTWFEMDQAGRPSRWNTLRARRVLRWAEGIRA